MGSTICLCLAFYLFIGLDTLLLQPFIKFRSIEENLSGFLIVRYLLLACQFIEIASAIACVQHRFVQIKNGLLRP